MLNINYIKNFPTQHGVYLWKKKDKVLYVWKANNLKKRLEQYFRTWIWVWKENMVMQADNIDYFLTKNEEEALILEEKLVKKYNPPYNSLLKWDNAYIYIKIWNQVFPKVEFTHFKDNNWTFIWPKPYKKDLKNMFLILRRILKFRTCSDTKFKKWKLCSDYTLWLCSWWCIKKDNKEYLRNIKVIKNFFNWKIKEIQSLIKDKIDKAIEEENFEYANILKDFYFKIDKLSQKQNIELEEKINWIFVKIRKEKNIYFMVYTKFIDGKLVDIVKLKNDENNFLKEMKNEWIIKSYKKLKDNFYFCNI